MEVIEVKLKLRLWNLESVIRAQESERDRELFK